MLEHPSSLQVQDFTALFSQLAAFVICLMVFIVEEAAAGHAMVLVLAVNHVQSEVIRREVLIAFGALQKSLRVPRILIRHTAFL